MDIQAVKDVLNIYFDANYEADESKIAQVFHEQAHIFGRSESGELIDFDKSSFVNLIASLSPETGPRIDEIISLDFIGDYAAVSRVRLQVGEIRYTDIISLLQLDGKWRIISKVYSGVQV